MILVSACLAGVNCRYDGTNRLDPELAKRICASKAILKAKSPACASGHIYDGSFTGTLREGSGVTAELLRRNSICVEGR